MVARAAGADADRLLSQFAAGGGVGALAAGLQASLAAGAEPGGALAWDPRRLRGGPGAPSGQQCACPSGSVAVREPSVSSFSAVGSVQCAA